MSLFCLRCGEQLFKPNAICHRCNAVIMPYDKSYQNSFYNKIKDKRVDIEEVDEYWEKDTDLGPLDPS